MSTDYDPFEYDPRGYDDYDPATDYGFPVGDTTQRDIGAMRSDLVTARQTIRRAIAGDDADLETAAGLIDATLQGLCPHDPAGHFHTYADSGEELTTCTACGVSWYTGRRYGEVRS